MSFRVAGRFRQRPISEYRAKLIAFQRDQRLAEIEAAKKTPVAQEEKKSK